MDCTAVAEMSFLNLFGKQISSLIIHIYHGSYQNEGISRKLYLIFWALELKEKNDILKSFLKAYLASLLGIGSVINNIRQIQSALSRLQNVSDDPSLQIEDFKIAHVPVRLYRPKQNIVDDTKQKCVVFFHGGGWMFLSIGELILKPKPKPNK